MIRQFALLITFIGIHLSISSTAQVVDDMGDESKLYAETKQVNQFFRRFNGEEDEKGNRYYPKDKRYRSDKLRKQYLQMLFDNSNQYLDKTVKNTFANDILDENKPQFLDFHGGDWYAEVSALFTYKGKSTPISLFLVLEKAGVGTQWNIFKIHSEVFKKPFERDTSRIGKFLHPMSHELDFMNLRKAFSNKDSINQYVSKSFQADQLSVFLFELNQGNLTFTTIKDVKFHFFQLDNWYFELSRFNRDSYNRGWLIANLTAIKNKQEEAILKRYLFHEN